MREHSSGPLRVVVGDGLLSSGLQLADFVAVFADGGFPLRAAIDKAGMGDQGLQRLDTFSLDGGDSAATRAASRASTHACRKAHAKHLRPMSENLICG